MATRLLDNEIFARCRSQSPPRRKGEQQPGASTEIPNIFEAILANRVDAVERLIDMRSQDYVVVMKFRDTLGRTPLYYACYIGNIDIVSKLLMTAVANIETPDVNGRTPLFIASYCGHRDIVSYLLDMNANVHAKDDIFGWTPLLAAVWSGHTDVVVMLLNAKSSLMMRDKNGRDSLFLASQRCWDELADLLLSKCSLAINGVDNFCRTPLYVAAQMGCTKITKRLLAHGANTEIADIDGRKSLYMAQKLNLEPIARILIEAGADASRTTIDSMRGNGVETEPCRGEFLTFLSAPFSMKVTAMCESGNCVWGGCGDGTLVVWDTGSHRQLACQLRAQNGLIHHMISLGHGRIWSLSANHDIYVWQWNELATDAPSIRLVENFSQGTQEILCIFKSEHRVFGGSCSSIYIWDNCSADLCREIALDAQADAPDTNMSGYDVAVSSILFYEQHVYCVIKNYVFRYKLQGDTLEFACLFCGHTDLVTDLKIAGGHLWTASRDNSIRVWDVSTAECIRTLGGAGAGEIRALCFTRDRQILSGEDDGRIRSWDTEEFMWKRTFPYRHNKRLISCMNWCDSTSNLWVGCLDKQVSCWR